MATGGARPGAGRPKGSVDRNLATARELMASIPGSNPIIALAHVVAGNVPCRTCIDENRKPTGKTWYQPKNGGEPKQRKCQSCWGTLCCGSVFC